MSTMTLRKSRTGLLTLGSLLTALVMMFSMVSPSFASASPGEELPDRSSATFREAAEIGTVTADEAKQLAVLAQAVTFDDKAVMFDYAQALELGADESFATDYARGILLADGTVQNAPATEALVLSASDEELTQAAAACRGTNGVGYYWWGHQLRVDSCNTQLLVGALTAGAGIAAVAAVITAATGAGAVAGTIAAAVLTVGAGAVTACNMYGNGVFLNQLWTGTPFCWGQ